jgi:hypothetical protein
VRAGLAALSSRVSGVNLVPRHRLASVDLRDDRFHLGLLVAPPKRLLDGPHIVRPAGQHARSEHRESKLLRRQFACVAEVEDDCQASLDCRRLASGTEMRDSLRERVSWRAHRS